MKKYLSILLASSFTSLVLASVGQAASRHKISGTWQLDRALSTNGRSELPRTFGQDILGQTLESADNWSSLESDPDASELLEATELLKIFRNGPKVTINAMGGVNVVLTRTVFTDGRENRQRFGFLSGISQARWEGTQLILETTSAEQQASEKFALSDDGTLLYVTIRIDRNDWSTPLIIERVYDRVS